MISQEYVKRKVEPSRGNSGWATDYVDFKEFMNEVTDKANSSGHKIKSIQYIYEKNGKDLDVAGAVIIYES